MRTRDRVFNPVLIGILVGLLLVALMISALRPLTSGYVIALNYDPGHYEDVCTSSNGRVCYSYRKEWINDVYRIDISSCDLKTVLSGGLGATFCRYNSFFVTVSQYSRAQLGKYIDLSRGDS